jgi:hypothetical protein
MAINQAICNSFKVEILKGLHDFTATTGNTFKLALYDNEATLSKSTTAFQQTDEVANSGTYSEGGGTLTSVTPTLSSDTAVCDFLQTYHLQVQQFLHKLLLFITAPLYLV